MYFNLLTFLKQCNELVTRGFVADIGHIQLYFFRFSLVPSKVLHQALFDVLAFANVNDVTVFVVHIIDASI